MKNKFASTALCAFLGIAVIGCGGSGGPSGPPPNSNEVKYKQVTNRIVSDFKKGDPIKLTASLSKPSSTGPLTGSLKIEVQGQPYVFDIQSVSVANDGSSVSGNLVQPIVEATTISLKPAAKAKIQPLITAFQVGNQVIADLTITGTSITGTGTITNGAKTTGPQPVNETVGELSSIKGFRKLLLTALVSLLKEGATVVP